MPARAIRRIGEYFSDQINGLSEQQWMDYFSDLLLDVNYFDRFATIITRMCTW